MTSTALLLSRDLPLEATLLLLAVCFLLALCVVGVGAVALCDLFFRDRS